jgi:hypothetical protein
MIDGDATSVLDYGAVADGTTDNSAAFQSAIDYVTGLTGGGSVYVPQGIYLIDAQVNLKDNVKVYGVGTIKAGASIKDTSDGYFQANGTDCLLEGLTFDGDTARTQTCNFDPDGLSGGTCYGIFILCQGSPKVEIRECTFKNVGKDAVYVGFNTSTGEACGDCLITENNISECHRSGITLEGFRSAIVTNNIITDIYEGSIDLEVDDKTPDNQGVNAIISFNHIGVTNQTDRADKNQQRIDVTNQETGGDATSNVVLQGNTIYDYWETVDTARTDGLELIDITTQNCRVTVQGNVLRTNAVTSSASGLLNINGGSYVQTGGNLVEYFGSDTSDSGTYGVLGGIMATSTPNNYITIGDDRVLGNIDRAVYIRNCDSVKIDGTIIKTATTALAGVYTDACTNLIITNCIIDDASRAVYLKDTTTVMLQDSVFTPNAYNIEWNGTNTYVKASNIITSKYITVGAWATSIGYTTGYRVRRAAMVWRCVSGHTSASGDRPGDSTGYATYWKFEGYSEAANSSREMTNTGTEASQYSENLIIRTT